MRPLVARLSTISTKTLYALISHATCPAHPLPLDLITTALYVHLVNLLPGYSYLYILSVDPFVIYVPSGLFTRQILYAFYKVTWKHFYEVCCK